jgi:hypothetical protein
VQAETAAYPELRLVAVMHNDDLSYAKSFDKALEGLFEAPPEVTAAKEPGAAAAGLSLGQLIRQAGDAFQNYLRSLGEKQYAGAAQALEELEAALQDLAAKQEAANRRTAEYRRDVEKGRFFLAGTSGFKNFFLQRREALWPKAALS